jgi:hypothetical protein
MTSISVAVGRGAALVMLAGVLTACGASSPGTGTPPVTGGAAGGGTGGVGLAAGGSVGSAGHVGSAGSVGAGGSGVGAASGDAGGAAGSGGIGGTATGSAGAINTGGSPVGGSGDGKGGMGGQAGLGGGAGRSVGGSAGTAPPGCNLPAPVSFQKDVLPFLMKSCGSSGGDGCHVIDGVSTMSAGGYDHGYDWITAGAHASSCPEKPTPYRYQVVMAVIEAANPATCSKSRRMPPPNATGRAALTACQSATLQAWLNEPLVTQMHRADDSSPTTPYPMPPFN